MPRRETGAGHRRSKQRNWRCSWLSSPARGPKESPTLPFYQELCVNGQRIFTSKAFRYIPILTTRSRAFSSACSTKSENTGELHCEQQPERVQLAQLHQRSCGGASWIWVSFSPSLPPSSS